MILAVNTMLELTRRKRHDPDSRQAMDPEHRYLKRKRLAGGAAG